MQLFILFILIINKDDLLILIRICHLFFSRACTFLNIALFIDHDFS